MFESLGRRRFLRRGVAALIGSSIPWLAVSGAADKKILPRESADFLEAMDRIKNEVKPGIVILVPQEERARGQLALQLTLLFQDASAVAYGSDELPLDMLGRDPAVELLFCQAVFLCLSHEQARHQFGAIRSDTAVLLLDTEAKPLASLPQSPTLFQGKFLEEMTGLLHGVRGERLARTAEAQRRVLGTTASREIDVALKNLDAHRYRIREEASRTLEKTAGQATAILMQAHSQTRSLEVQRRIERLLAQALRELTAIKPELFLPYGTSWETHRGECSPTQAAGTSLYLRQKISFASQESKAKKKP